MVASARMWLIAENGMVYSFYRIVGHSTIDQFVMNYDSKYKGSRFSGLRNSKYHN